MFYPTLAAPKRAQQCFYSEKSGDQDALWGLVPGRHSFRQGIFLSSDALGGRPWALAWPSGSVVSLSVFFASPRTLALSAESSFFARNLRTAIRIFFELSELIWSSLHRSRDRNEISLEIPPYIASILLTKAAHFAQESSSFCSRIELRLLLHRAPFAVSLSSACWVIELHFFCWLIEQIPLFPWFLAKISVRTLFPMTIYYILCIIYIYSRFFLLYVLINGTVELFQHKNP